MKKASYSTVLDTERVRCDLCPHHCVMTEGKRGLCLTRQHLHGELVSLNYCRPVSSHIDPIEKKPLYHFYPGSEIYSSGPNGCTFKCTFCQNCEIAQSIVPTEEITADAFAKAVIDSGTIGIAYTYSEPYIWFETIMEVGSIVKEHGLKNVMVTNGYMEPDPLADLLRIVDAMNIDIKAIRQDFYKNMCKATLEPVLRTCETVKKHCHLEITNLVIPGQNDSEEEFRELTDFVAGNLGRDTPLHFSRYFPRNRATFPPTPEKTLLTAWKIAREKLDYVYIGNIDAGDKANTYCPSCNTLLILRSGYSARLMEGLVPAENSKMAVCPSCGTATNIKVAGFKG
jgi:pyruvate formate lyase activating enzyme